MLCTRLIYGIDGTNGIDGENREDREFKELRERLSLNSLNSLISYFNQHTDFSSERCSSGADMKKVRMGCTKAYCSFGLLIEASLMRCYQEKFLVRRVADATLGKNPDDGLYKKYCSLSGPFLLAAADAPLSREKINCQKGLDLAYRKSEHPRIVLKRTASGAQFGDRSKMTPYHN